MASPQVILNRRAKLQCGADTPIQTTTHGPMSKAEL